MAYHQHLLSSWQFLTAALHVLYLQLSSLPPSAPIKPIMVPAYPGCPRKWMLNECCCCCCGCCCPDYSFKDILTRSIFQINARISTCLKLMLALLLQKLDWLHGIHCIHAKFQEKKELTLRSTCNGLANDVWILKQRRFRTGYLLPVFRTWHSSHYNNNYL